MNLILYPAIGYIGMQYVIVSIGVWARLLGVY